MKKKVLIIAYAFPPIPYSGSFRPLRLCKGLAKRSIVHHVLTIKEYKDIPNDYKLLAQVPKESKIHRTSIIDPWRRYQPFKIKHARLPGFKYINKIISYLLRFLSIPDHMVLWLPFAIAKGRKIIQEHNIDTMWVTSPPNSSLLIGYFLKKATGVKFIADFRDPVVGNIAETNLIHPTDFFSKFEKWIRIKFEKLIIQYADGIIANTHTHKIDLEQTYPNKKINVVRNSFEDTNYNNNQQYFNDFTISHVGSMYGLRSADVLFKALKRLGNDINRNGLRVKFVGSNDPQLRKSVEEYDLGKCVSVDGLVPHEQAIGIMQKSHLLLLIKATGEGSLGQIPAKFFEYIGTKNKILLIGPVKSEVADLIQTYDLGYVVENDVQEMKGILRKLYQEHQEGTLLKIPDSVAKDFSSTDMVDKIIRLF